MYKQYNRPVHVVFTQDFFLEEEVDDSGCIDTVDNCHVQPLKLVLQHCIILYKHHVPAFSTL